MSEPKTPIFFCRAAFLATCEEVFVALNHDTTWAQALGGLPLDCEPGLRIRLNHTASGGLLEAAVAPRGQGSRLMVTLFADHLERQRLEALAEGVEALFDNLSARLNRAPENLLPMAWPAVYKAPGNPPRILRRVDFQWTEASYPDAPADTMGEYTRLTHPLGITQFGADIHRLNPGERNCRNHVEIHEQEGFLILSGRCHIEIEGRVQALEAGDFCVTLPGEEHHLFNLGDHPCEILTFGGPDVFGSGAIYPHGRDEAWHTRVVAYPNLVPLRARQSVQIREFRGSDRDAIETCIRELQDFERAIDPMLRPAEEITFAYATLMIERTKQQAGKIFCADALESTIQAYAYISDLVVMPAYRQQGIGADLLREAEQFASKAGLVWLRVWSLAGNNTARSLYEEAGFREENIVLRKALS